MKQRLGLIRYYWVTIIIVVLILGGCYRPGPGSAPWKVSEGAEFQDTQPVTNGETVLATAVDVVVPEITSLTPTPNPPILLPTPRSEIVSYIVQRGDTLRKIAQIYQVSVGHISSFNELANPDLIEVGQVLRIPLPNFEDRVPAFKIIPDSELVHSPSNADFDVFGFINTQESYLAAYTEEVDEVYLSGAEIVERVALEYSVNPRLLLAVLEYQSGWVTQRSPDEATLDYPIQFYDQRRSGLYKQLGWAANLINEGYYLWKVNGINAWNLADDSILQVEPTINPGTAGVLNLMRNLFGRPDWDQAVSEEGIFATYFNFFGYPFDLAFEPMIPDNLAQPVLQLPFEENDIWSYTGGPHGGWASGSAWAALDFAPPGEPRGCTSSDAWVVAAAPGQIVYSDHGAVIQDLSGDGIWQTGWSIFYMHIETRNRVDEGVYLEAGDRIGHPSCEGGFSTGTHLHIARRYNGEWIAADGEIPFVMDGWVAAGYGFEYNGYLIKGDRTLEAWNGRTERNAIQR